MPVTIAEVTGATAITRALLDLNNDHASELSWLEPQRLRYLVAEAFMVRRVGHGDALLVAFDQNAAYDSPNFLWFHSRYRRFVYVDRIVVAGHARGRGHARHLYRDVFEHAAQDGHDRVVCEVNSDPPNPMSDAFHAALGFHEVGSGSIHGGSKSVRHHTLDGNGPARQAAGRIVPDGARFNCGPRVGNDRAAERRR